MMCAAFHHTAYVEIICVQKRRDGDTKKLFTAYLLLQSLCEKLDTSRQTPPFSNTGSGTRQAFRWVCGWCECFESLDCFRYQKASVCRILVVLSEK